MSAVVRTERVHGHDGIVIENEHVRAVILPKLGGRVWALYDRKRDRQWVWHRHDVPLTTNAPGDAYDDVWAGGWEQLFPNDGAGEFEGRLLPDHGELWTTAWDVAEVRDGAEGVVRLTANARARAVSCTKEFRLATDADAMRVRYRVENRERESYHFLFKEHLPVAITPDCRLALPGGTVTAVDTTFGTMLGGTGPYSWPMATGRDGSTLDLRHVPGVSSSLREFVYVHDLPAGWCGFDDPSCDASLRMHYDRRHFPYLWLFMTFGGWRDCYTVVLEPCTNMPKDLTAATRLGQAALMTVDGVFETEVTVALQGVK